MGSLSIRKGKPGRVEARNGTKRSGNTSDLAKLWNDAVEEYCRSTKRPLSDLDQIDDFQDAIVGTHEAAGVFDKQRHPETTMNTVMTTIEPCMDWVNTGFQFLADNASGTVRSPMPTRQARY